MSKIWDEREKSLENEYFRRKEQELIEKLRAKREEERAHAAALRCPKCEGRLEEITFEDVQIDRCSQCAGVWLDAGELELLTTKETGGWFSRLWKSLAG